MGDWRHVCTKKQYSHFSWTMTFGIGNSHQTTYSALSSNHKDLCLAMDCFDNILAFFLCIYQQTL